MQNNPAGPAGPSSDVLGPPPSYDSVVYGSDAGASRVVNTGTNIPPPSQYSTANYGYPVPPSYPVNPAYPGASTQPQYPTAYPQPPGTAAVIQQPTILNANEQPVQTGRRLMRAVLCLILIPIVIFIIFLFIFRLH